MPDTELIYWARAQTEELLSTLSARWRHVQAVAAQAIKVSTVFQPSDAELLVASAYLHDIGYAPSLIRTKFHPLDGAVYLRGHGYERLACLVAHHSESRFEAELRGLATELSEFPRERSALSDALAYCDQVTGPTGEPLSLKQRSADILQRYGPDNIVWQAYRRALPYLALEVGRTTLRLRKNGLSR